MKALLRKIRQILRDRRVRRFFTRVVSTLAAIVVFVTTYALVLPAITLEKVAACGIEEHQHTDDCWSEELICDLPESDGHVHDDSCYTVTRELVCTIDEHEHSVEKGCYDEDGSLVCSEIEHTHSDDCYEEVRTLTCEIPESEGHHHTDECYEKVLTCGKEYHIHSAACYENDADKAAYSGSAESAAVAASTGIAAMEDDSSAASMGSSGAATAASTGASTAGSSAKANTDGAGAEDVSTDATTSVLPEKMPEEELSAGYVPQLETVDMDTVLNKRTGFYYFDASEYASNHPEEEMPSSSSGIEDWKKYKTGDELASEDLLRLYLSYTVPAGTLNSTNQVSRYRLPSNIRLTDDQITAINETVNGVAGQYVDYDTLEITDPEKYEFYRGAEAIEGDRTPDQDVNQYLYDLLKDGKDGQEYISAVVKAENVYENTLNANGNYVDGSGSITDGPGEYLGQDLIFIWTPYSIEKNQNEYDKDGQPTKAGEKITGWFACDFNTSQVEWESVDSVDSAATADEGEDGTAAANVEKTAEIVLANEDKSAGIKEISETLTLVETDARLEDQTAKDRNEDASEGTTDDATVETAEDAAADGTEDATAVTSEDTSDTSTEAIAEDSTEEAAEALTENVSAASAEEQRTETEEAGQSDQSVKYKDGTLTAEGDGYKITLGYTAEAQIPDNAYLSVHEITAETDEEAYEACLEQAKQQVESTDDKTVQKVDTTATRFFDIEILAEETVDNTAADDTVIEETAVAEDNTDTVDVDGTVSEKADAETVIRKIEPAAPVNVNIQILDAKADGHTVPDKGDSSDTAKSADVSADPTILHFAEKGVETIESTTIEAITDETPTNEASSDESAAQESGSVQSGAGTGTAVQFQADSFSIYGVIYTTITTTILTAAGETYEITVDYDEDAEIPDDA